MYLNQFRANEQAALHLKEAQAKAKQQLIAAYPSTIENKKNFTRFSTSLSQILIPRWKQKNIAWHKESTPQAE